MLRHSAFSLALLSSIACSDKAEETGVTVDCTAISAFVTGTVTDADGAGVANPEVWATNEAGTRTDQDWNDENGRYELNLDPDMLWAIQAAASDGSCASEATEIVALACAESVVDLVCL